MLPPWLLFLFFLQLSLLDVTFCPQKVELALIFWIILFYDIPLLPFVCTMFFCFRGRQSSRELFFPRIFSWISMEGLFTEKPNSTNSEQIDLTLKLSPCGQNVEEKWLTRWSSMTGEKAKSMVENGAQVGPFVLCMDRSCSLPAKGEKGLIRFGDLQTMRRVRTGKRLLLEKQRRAAEAAAEGGHEPLAVSPPPLAGGQQLANPYGDSWQWHEGGASSNIHTSPKQENSSMVSPKAMVKEMPLWPSDNKLESPSKKLKHVNPYIKGNTMDIHLPSVTTTGDGPGGKRIEGLLYKYRKGQVCIVCVCHGNLLSPSEFVMHAGGKEVENPMKHITLCSD